MTFVLFLLRNSVNMQKQTNEVVNMENHIREIEQENEHYVLDLQSFERQTDSMQLLVLVSYII